MIPTKKKENRKNAFILVPQIMHKVQMQTSAAWCGRLGPRNGWVICSILNGNGLISVKNYHDDGQNTCFSESIHEEREWAGNSAKFVRGLEAAMLQLPAVHRLSAETANERLTSWHAMEATAVVRSRRSVVDPNPITQRQKGRVDPLFSLPHKLISWLLIHMVQLGNEIMFLGHSVLDIMKS